MAKIIIFGDVKTDKEIKIDSRIKSICEGADLVIANLEGPFIKSAKPRKDKKGRPLSSNENIIKLIKDLNLSMLVFGNNHILDYGLDGLEESIALAKELGLDWVGASDGKKDKYFHLDKKNKIVVLSFSHREGPVAEVGVDGIGPYALPSFNVIENDIRSFNEKGYSVIVSYHGGEEFFNFPWPRRHAWSEELLKAGALLVVGHHSHSIQPVLKTDFGYLALGLGNTYFHTVYQEAHKGTNGGIFLEVDTKNKTIKYHCLEANWEIGSLNISSGASLLPIEIAKAKLLSLWCKEARRKVYFNKLNTRKNNHNLLKFLLIIVRNFLSLLRSSLSSVRDRDIMIASIPFFGKYILSKSISKNPKNFRF